MAVIGHHTPDILDTSEGQNSLFSIKVIELRSKTTRSRKNLEHSHLTR